jgi:TolA-binding protein
MNNPLRAFCIFVIVSLLHSQSVFSEQKVIVSDDQFDFARHLMDKKEYRLAVTEFERFVYFFPEDEKVPEARYLRAACYLEAKDYEAARDALIEIQRLYMDRPIWLKALFLIGESYYRQGVPEEAERYFKLVLERGPELSLRNAALYRAGWSQMQQDRWAQASETFKMVEAHTPLYDSAMALSERSLEGESLPFKDPRTAGFLSAVVPGLGHAYCNRYKDGLMAFALNGLFIWAAYEAFEEDHNVLGGILAFMEVGWYFGSIYSAVNCAHKHNRKISDELRQSLPDRMRLQLLSSRDMRLGLALRVEF